jgi:hypothetical protein
VGLWACYPSILAREGDLLNAGILASSISHRLPPVLDHLCWVLGGEISGE